MARGRTRGWTRVIPPAAMASRSATALRARKPTLRGLASFPALIAAHSSGGRRIASRTGAPCFAKRARLGPSSESQEPRKECGLVNHQLTTRGLEYRTSGIKAVRAAVSHSPRDAITTQQMRVALRELTRGENFAGGRRPINCKHVGSLTR